jgi:hypothetical protein
MSEPTVKQPSIPAYKAVLAYVFMVFGLTIGARLGAAMAYHSPAQSGGQVALCSFVGAALGFGLGYIISAGIDASVTKRSHAILAKWVAGIGGFLAYAFLLAQVR